METVTQRENGSNVYVLLKSQVKIMSGKCSLNLITQKSFMITLCKTISKLEWAEKWVFGAKMESMGIGNYFKKLNWEGE